jgi:PAS domain S-box-containing protein
MRLIRLSLQNRVVWLLGASLVALQLALGYSFDRALDQAQDERAAALARSAHTSVNFAVATAFHRQRDGLEMFAGWARHQASTLVISPKKQRAPNFFQRVFGPRVLPPEPTPEPIRLASRIKGLVEYADRRPVIWYLNTEALPDLSKEIQGTARRLDTRANQISRNMFCSGADCLLVSVRPFTTPDNARIIAVAAESLDGLLSSMGASAGYQLQMQIVNEAAGPAQTGGGIDFERMIGGVSMDVPRLRMQVKQGAELRLRDMRRQYYLIAGAGVPLSLLLVAFLLRPLVERVGVLRVALPKLTEGDFGAATSLLRAAQAKARVRDETTELMRTAEDITGRLQGMQSDLARQAADLRRERDHMQLLLDTTPACIVLLEGTGKIVSANAMASTLLRVARAALVGRDILDFLDLEPKAGFTSLIQAAEGGPTSPLEVEFKDAEGGRHIMEWRLAPIREDSQRRVLAVGTDVTRLREVERRLVWLRTHDEATSLLNRRSIEQSVAALPGVRCLLLVRPKNEAALHDMLNETGRAEVQQQIADQLRTITQPYPNSEAALLDRFQFAVLVHATRAAVEAQLPNFVEAQRPILLEVGGKSVQVELLLQGIELNEPAWRENINDKLDALLKLAATLDSAVHWLTLETLHELEQEDYRHWVNEIDAALKSDRITIVYQPIFDAKTLETSHSEVLVRMIGRDGTIIPPGAFLRAAERSGQMRQIDRVVFAKAIGTLLDLQARGVRHNLSVNMSAPALQEPYLAQMIDDAISLRGLEPGRLMLELVETQAINTLESAVQLMLKFKRQGIQMMLDDFGIGFTSFEYLRELPFAYVKIDQLFVKNLAKRTDDRSLIRSIHEMVRGLGRKTIAEGVEDAASLRILQKIGVDAVQGFGLARPGREINLSRASLGH